MMGAQRVDGMAGALNRCLDACRALEADVQQLREGPTDTPHGMARWVAVENMLEQHQACLAAE